MPFQKGHSYGNGGKAHSAVSFGREIRRQLLKKPKEVRQIARDLIDTALDKEHPDWRWAVQLLLDRVDGKPATSEQLAIPGGNTLKIEVQTFPATPGSQALPHPHINGEAKDVTPEEEQPNQ